MNRSHFISYSPADARDFVVHLRDELEGGTPPIAVWHDKRDLRPGEEWDNQIDRAIRRCQSLIFIMTRDSVSDDSVCKSEWSRALKYRKPIVPVLVDRDAEMPFRLDGRQYIDFAEFGPAIATLRDHLDWLSSPEGTAHALRLSLGDARRTLVRAQDDRERERLAEEIQQIESQVASYEALARSEEDAAAIATESRRLGQRAEAMMPPAERPVPTRGTAPTQDGGSHRIFLAYRRSDSAPYAGRLRDALSDRFGWDSVFRDIDGIGVGTDFREAINRLVGSSDVVLVLIGRGWLSISPDTGKAPIHDPRDYLRLEIEAALKSDAYVVPILVEGAKMPSSAELPRALRPLARRNGLTLSDARWSYDVERLISAIEDAVGG